MRTTALLLILASLALGGFAIWGKYSEAGQRRYDEKGVLRFGPDQRVSEFTIVTD